VTALSFVGSSNNVIQGNLIGLDGVPPPAMLGDGRWNPVTTGNRMDGIHFVNSPFNLVGDTVAGARNVITKNLGNGLRFETGSSGNYIGNTYLGTDPTGTLGVGNGKDGVKVEFGANNIQIVNSVLAGNTGYGVNAGPGTVVTGVPSSATEAASTRRSGTRFESSRKPGHLYPVGRHCIWRSVFAYENPVRTQWLELRRAIPI